jgi:hypothetical protein
MWWCCCLTKFLVQLGHLDTIKFISCYAEITEETINFVLIDNETHPIRAIDIVKWSPQAVALYANTQPLFQPYATQLEEYGVDGRQFLQLEQWVLRDGLGVFDTWTQFKMILHLRGLLGQDPTATLVEESRTKQEEIMHQERAHQDQESRSTYRRLSWEPSSTTLRYVPWIITSARTHTHIFFLYVCCFLRLFGTEVDETGIAMLTRTLQHNTALKSLG